LQYQRLLHHLRNHERRRRRSPSRTIISNNAIHCASNTSTAPSAGTAPSAFLPPCISVLTSVISIGLAIGSLGVSLAIALGFAAANIA
jgi:hypothetical protein